MSLVPNPPDGVIPRRAERGQITSAHQMWPRLRHIIFCEQVYLAPRGRDRAIMGSVKDTAGFVQLSTVAGAVELITKGIRIAPHIATAKPGSILAGLRASTPDGCPIIGPVPGWEGVSIAAGHHSNGLLLSSITGQIVTSVLTNVQGPLDIFPYTLQRFETAVLEPSLDSLAQ